MTAVSTTNFVPEVDGIFCVRFRPQSSGTTASVYLNMSGTICFQAVSTAGIAVVAEVPARKGKSYTLEASQSGVKDLYFMPFSKA